MVKGLVVQADPARETRGLLGLGAGAPPRHAGLRPQRGSPGAAPAAGARRRGNAGPLVKFSRREREARGLLVA